MIAELVRKISPDAGGRGWAEVLLHGPDAVWCADHRDCPAEEAHTEGLIGLEAFPAFLSRFGGSVRARAIAPWLRRAWVGYRAASHGGADEDAVLGMRIGSRDGATRAHRPGLSPVPLSRVRQAVQRAQRRCAEPDPVPLRRHRPRGALAPALQAGPARSARDVCYPRHRVQL